MPPPTVKPSQSIPFGRSTWHFTYVQNVLASVLLEIKSIKALEKKILWVSCRLNTTKTGNPVFAGWVESDEAITIRVKKGLLSAPIDIRFGDTHPSDLYLNCLKLSPGKILPSKRPASSGSQEIGKNFYDETDRRSAPIKIADRSVGTLNAAFLGDPASQDQKIKDILVKWAQDKSSDLVTYIQNNLEYSPRP